MRPLARRAAIAAGAVLLLGAAGCAPTATSAAAPPLRVADDCVLAGTPRAKDVHLLLPEGFEPRAASSRRGGCGWEKGAVRIYLTAVGGDSGDRTLDEYYRGLAGDVGTGDDDDVEQLRLDRDVEVFPGVRGDRLSYFIYSDGDPHDVIAGQGRGVDLTVAADAPDRRPDRESRVPVEVSADLVALYDAIADSVRIADR